VFAVRPVRVRLCAVEKPVVLTFEEYEQSASSEVPYITVEVAILLVVKVMSSEVDETVEVAVPVSGIEIVGADSAGVIWPPKPSGTSETAAI
jgi:hypothetical protein